MIVPSPRPTLTSQLAALVAEYGLAALGAALDAAAQEPTPPPPPPAPPRDTLPPRTKAVEAWARHEIGLRAVAGMLADWSIVRERVLAMPRSRRTTLAALLAYTGRDHLSCYPSLEGLSKRAGLSRRSIAYALRDLQACGAIVGHRSYGAARITAEYAIHPGAHAAFYASLERARQRTRAKKARQSARRRQPCTGALHSNPRRPTAAGKNLTDRPSAKQRPLPPARARKAPVGDGLTPTKDGETALRPQPPDPAAAARLAKQASDEARRAKPEAAAVTALLDSLGVNSTIVREIVSQTPATEILRAVRSLPAFPAIAGRRIRSLPGYVVAVIRAGYPPPSIGAASAADHERYRAAERQSARAALEALAARRRT